VVVMSFSSFQKGNSPSVAFPVKLHVLKTAWDFPSLHVSEELVVRQGEPGVKLLDMPLKFVRPTAAAVGQVKQQIPSKDRSSLCSL